VSDKVNLAAKLALFSDHFAPRTVTTMNDYKVQITKIEGVSSGTPTLTPTTSSSS